MEELSDIEKEADGILDPASEPADVTYWDETDDDAGSLVGPELTDDELNDVFAPDDEDDSGGGVQELTDEELQTFIDSIDPRLRTASWHLAPSLVRLRAEINRKWPKRDKRSDGSIGDARHAASVSDHNPNARHSVDALDIDNDGISPMTLVHAAIKHPACNYVIWNRVIYSRAYGFRARRYTGVSPHTEHIHVSIIQSSSAEQNTRGWLSATPTPVPAPTPTKTDRPYYALPAWTLGNKYFGPYLHSKPPKYQTILNIQKKLYSIEYHPGTIDGMYGPTLYKAVIAFQRNNGLQADGKIGIRTYNKLRARK